MLQLFCRWEGLIASEANRDHWDVAQLGAVHWVQATRRSMK
jgi:hypothetical protein